MGNNIRIPIDLANEDEQVVRVKIEQEFENLEILSLKITNSDAYRRMCADFGVVCGRVALNNGFGVQNAKVTVFVPVESADRERPEIMQLYPFETVNDSYPNGVRFNLLPRVRNNNPSHRAVGNFPDITDFSQYPQMVEVFEKYYKFTTTTNESGDYMIFGVPLGTHDVMMDFDVFDTKSFEITANDLVQQTTINKSLDDLKVLLNEQATETNIDPNKIPDFIYHGNNNFDVEIKTNISDMPNIFNGIKNINVSPFWGDSNNCDVGITRCDFKINFKYEPTAVFFGYLDSVSGGYAIYGDYKYPINRQPEILAVDTSLGYYTGDIYPYQEPQVVVYRLDDKLTPGSRKRLGVFTPAVDRGIFRLALPMYMDYYTTNEFGDLVPSTDTKTGIPTKGYYAFEMYETSEIWYNRRNPQGWYGNTILPGIRIPSSADGDLNLGGWEGTWNGLFEYDLVNKKRKFYTIKTTYHKHNRDNVMEDGDEIVWFPQTNPNKVNSKTFWNYPIDYRDVKNIDDVSIIGSVLMPRMGFIPPPAYDTSSPDFDVEGPVNLVNVMYIDPSETYNKEIYLYESILGIGVGVNGVNYGTVFSDIYRADEFINSDGTSVFGKQATWDYGDNTSLPEPIPTAFALKLAASPDSTANEFSIHYPYTQAVSPYYTYGTFISSVFNTSSVDFIDIGIYDITEELENLITNGIYSSFQKGDPNEFGTDYGSATHYKANMYNSNFYYFGAYENKNALIDIQNYYSYRQ